MLVWLSVWSEVHAALHMAQSMLLPLTVSCFGKIQIGFTFLAPAHLGSPGKGAVKRVYVCAYISFDLRMRAIVVLGLVFSIPSREVGSGKRLRNDLFCVEWDVKPQLDRSIESACADYSCCGFAGDPVPSDGDLPGQPTGAGPRGVGPALGHAVCGHAEGFPAGTRLSVRQCR